MTLKVNWHFSKEELPVNMKNLMIKDFMTLREAVIEITNEKLESWNKEFDTCIGDMGEDNIRYNKWIASRFNDICSMVNEKHPETSVFIRSEVSHDADFVSYARWDESLSLYYTLSEM